jgi:tetraacyldisaccharide 4'-kinase
VIYGSIAGLRRLFYELFQLRTELDIPTVIVGNITVGGTGKTPMVIYLSELLNSSYNVSVLSRGYGRKTNGFLEVQLDSKATNVGDEPKEVKFQHPDIPVFVCENRIAGIATIKEQNENVNLVLLDDGFQHLPLRGKVNLILSNYHRPFYDDFVMPSGRLREFKSTAKGADIIVVTKCPSELKKDEALKIEGILEHYCQQIFFATYPISKPKLLFGDRDLGLKAKVVLVTGIAEGNKTREELNDFEVVKHFNYPDHSNFSKNNLLEWIQYCNDFEIENIVLTRKDSMRLMGLIVAEGMDFGSINVYEIHTEVSFLFETAETFKKVLIDLL